MSPQGGCGQSVVVKGWMHSLPSDVVVHVYMCTGMYCYCQMC